MILGRCSANMGTEAVADDNRQEKVGRLEADSFGWRSHSEVGEVAAAAGSWRVRGT